MSVQNRNILLLAHNYAGHPQDTSFLRNVQVDCSTEEEVEGAFQKDWIWLGADNVNQFPCICSEWACGISSVNEFCNCCEGGKEEEGDECDPESVPGFTEDHAAY